MITDSVAPMADPDDFDADYYVIDEPPAAPVTVRDPMDYRVVREQRLEIATHTPPFQIYWTVPLELDIDWAED